ncbi:hypothetical protein C8J56DRAFT_1030923 [Mycena floridula]|nr:hypothetical protein C8J56DRAFT_1030923 [Mycena floridula]
MTPPENGRHRTDVCRLRLTDEKTAPPGNGRRKEGDGAREERVDIDDHPARGVLSQDHFEQENATGKESNVEEETQQEFEGDWHQDGVPVDQWGQDNGAENEGVEEFDADDLGSLFGDDEEFAPEEPAPLTSQVTLINPTQVRRQSLPVISSPVSRRASSPPPTNYPVLWSVPLHAARRRSAVESSPESDSESSEPREASFSLRVSSPTRPGRSLVPEPSPSPPAPFGYTRCRSRSAVPSSTIDLPSVAESIGGAETAMDEEWVEGVLTGDHVEEESMVNTVPNVDEEALVDTEPVSLVAAQRKRRLDTDDESTSSCHGYDHAIALELFKLLTC